MREGLDIPEVSLVAIFEADKEGFLRSRRSLIQTIGRAARNINGKDILYGDILTKSMAQAIEETERRRKIQKEYNVFNNIDPKSILDIPEVSLVAILEADKEGFLRSRRSLIQTIGRAARNINGKAILYGDVITKSMAQAIEETERRRKIQKEYNVFNNIDPKSIIREVSEEVLNLDYGLDIEETKKPTEMNFTSKADIEKEISKLFKEIKKCSEELDFETAILKRDKMNKLKEMLLEL